MVQSITPLLTLTADWGWKVVQRCWTGCGSNTGQVSECMAGIQLDKLKKIVEYIRARVVVRVEGQ